jgi:WD40 repeat protein
VRRIERAAASAKQHSLTTPGRPAPPRPPTPTPRSPAVLLASQADGVVVAYDVRAPDVPLWKLAAHGSSTTALAASSLAEGLLATGSLDKTVKLWDVRAGAAAAPEHLSTKALAVGQVFSVAFFPDRPHLLAAGGGAGVLALWDTSEDAGDVTARVITRAPTGSAAAGGSTIAQYFAGRIRAPADVPGHGARARADGQPLA